MRVVIVGGGEIGFALAQGLSMENEVFVVDHNPEVADRFEPLEVQFVLGTGTSRDVLARAGGERADVVVACAGLDEVNIVSCAVARQMAKPRTICFVSREDLFARSFHPRLHSGACGQSTG
jgi:trk/ktr system potassium uptake protein